MHIEVSISNTVPTKHNHRILQPKIVISDHSLPNETAEQTYKRLSLMANALFARELLDQLRNTDRMAVIGNATWCDEYLSSVHDDHPLGTQSLSPPSLSPEMSMLIKAFADGLSGQLLSNLEKDSK